VRFRPLAFCCLLILCEVALPVVGSSQSLGLPPLPNQTIPAKDPDQERREHELAKKLSQERQAQLRRDTDNLLKLATELKQYVDKSNENTLSVEVIKKADEIERLAHSVKDKMKGN
jgi:hypothetical protein